MPHAEPGELDTTRDAGSAGGSGQAGHSVRIAGRPAEIVGEVTGLRHWDGDKRLEHPIG